MKGLWGGGGVSTMSLCPVIDDAVRTVTKDDFFYSHTQNVSERGSGFSIYYYVLVDWLEH